MLPAREEIKNFYYEELKKANGNSIFSKISKLSADYSKSALLNIIDKSVEIFLLLNM